MRRSLLAALGLLALVAPAHALHKNTPAAVRLTHGAPVAQPSTISWERYLTFASRTDILATGAAGSQIYLFNLFQYDCANGTPLLACPFLPEPLTRVTDGPGDPDNPTVNSSGSWVAFDADGAYGGGTGPGVGHRQIFLLDRISGTLLRLTDAADGDSVRPSLNRMGGKLVFESTASLLGSGGVSQIYIYDVRLGVLQRITNGQGPSTYPVLNRLGAVVAFESTARLRGDGADTGISQIFWYDVKHDQVFQLTDGNASSHHPFVSSAVKSKMLRAAGMRRVAILFDSEATNLPGTAGGPGRQVYAGSADLGERPPLVQLTPVVVPGCTPASPGEATFPTIDPTGRRIAFVGTGDPLCNGTTGRRAFVNDLRRAPGVLFQMTGRGDVQGPLGAFLGLWFLTVSTTDDLTGAGVCGHQLQIIDYFTKRWMPASRVGEVPPEPAPGNPNAACDDANACTTDACTAGLCTHTPIGGCP